MSNLPELTAWAVPRLSTLLPLPEEELRQVVSYVVTSPELSNPSAIATHFTDLLGSSSECLSFIEEFNQRRFPAAPTTSRQKPRLDDSSAPPRSNRKGQKQKQPLNKLPPVRKVENSFASSSEDLSSKVYRKNDLEDYMSTGARKAALTPTSKPSSQGPSRSSTPNPPPTSAPSAPPVPSNVTSKQPALQGTLTSDLLAPKKKPQKSKANTVAIPAGPTMRPPSSMLSDITSALRTLEIHTNPTLTATSVDKRRCNCSGRTHDLLFAAPNCLNCGKIICIKEGLAPCTFCGRDLISSEDMEAMRRALRDEQSKEKMNAHNASHKKTSATKTLDVYASKVNPSAGGSSISGPPPGASNALTSAMEQRDKLLGFQNTSAKRTRIIDQAADWETPDSGVNMWASPQERALQLREQQKKMRELEWDNKEDWEKRRVVVSIDLKGKKVSKEMRSMERPKFEAELPKEEEEPPVIEDPAPSTKPGGSSGLFSKNPLLSKGLIKPTWKAENEGPDIEDVRRSAADPDSEFGEWGKILKRGWRRVQDDMTDNEGYILDGGRLGGSSHETEKSIEPACG